MLRRNINPFWFVVVIALGFCSYGAMNWLKVEEPSEQQLKVDVEANYQLDIARMRAQERDGKLDISDEWEAKHRQAVRNEILGIVETEKKWARSWFVVGLALLIFSLGRILAQPLFSKKD